MLYSSKLGLQRFLLGKKEEHVKHCNMGQLGAYGVIIYFGGCLCVEGGGYKEGANNKYDLDKCTKFHMKRWGILDATQETHENIGCLGYLA